ncbi:MAG: hypothetical protein OXJ90_02485 [Spirochaetaceae bacterium]|nr:hypothetical protein [Spirochaetaceae bacterium]
MYDADERLFKMWYCGYPTASGRAATRPQRTGYPVSHDGAVWEKPAVRLFDFDGDGGANNICVENIGRVVKDDAEADPKRRYKLFLKKPQGIPDALGVAYSRDGVRWASRRTETGLATLPVDRFTALETRDGESSGHALTGPLVLPEQPCRLRGEGIVDRAAA